MREQITFDFAGSFSGAYRDIPVRSGESITDVSVSEGTTLYRPGANTELGGFGLPGSFGVTGIDYGIRIVWHYAATDERRTFTISYRFRGLAVAYDDVVDVNLRVWGEHWPVGLENLTAVMQLPRRTELSPSYRVWGNPPWVRAVVGRAPDRATLQAVQVPAHQFVEHRVALPAKPAHVDRRRAGPARATRSARSSPRSSLRSATTSATRRRSTTRKSIRAGRSSFCSCSASGPRWA